MDIKDSESTVTDDPPAYEILDTTIDPRDLEQIAKLLAKLIAKRAARLITKCIFISVVILCLILLILLSGDNFRTSRSKNKPDKSNLLPTNSPLHHRTSAANTLGGYITRPNGLVQAYSKWFSRGLQFDCRSTNNKPKDKCIANTSFHQG